MKLRTIYKSTRIVRLFFGVTFMMSMLGVYLLNYSAWYDGSSVNEQDSDSDQLLDGISIQDLNSEKTRSDDLILIDIIRKRFLTPASTEPYALSEHTVQSEGQTKIVDEFFKQKTHGVFVECGAYDGEFLSNTLFLERFRAWTGLLIEPEPDNFEALKKRHRKAIISNACLSSKSYPSEAIMRQENFMSETQDAENLIHDHVSGHDNYKIVQCFPFYSILLAANITTIDYFSLDVEGQELNILKTIPWHRVDIKVISVEYKHVKEGKMGVNSFMEDVGYHAYGEVSDVSGAFIDTVYVRQDLLSR